MLYSWMWVPFIIHVKGVFLKYQIPFVGISIPIGNLVASQSNQRSSVLDFFFVLWRIAVISCNDIGAALWMSEELL